MTAAGRWGLAFAVVVAGTVSGFGQAQPPALTECETATADVLLLRARVVQLEQQLVASQLEAERVRLEATFRARLQPPADYVFDWSTKQFQPPKAAPSPQP